MDFCAVRTRIHYIASVSLPCLFVPPFSSFSLFPIPPFLVDVIPDVLSAGGLYCTDVVLDKRPAISCTNFSRKPEIFSEADLEFCKNWFYKNLYLYISNFGHLCLLTAFFFKAPSPSRRRIFAHFYFFLSFPLTLFFSPDGFYGFSNSFSTPCG